MIHDDVSDLLDFIWRPLGKMIPGAGLPVIYSPACRYPGRQAYEQVIGQRMHKGFIDATRLGEALLSVFFMPEVQTHFGQCVTQAFKLCWGEARLLWIHRWGSKDLGQVNSRMARHRKGETRGRNRHSFNPHNKHCAGIQDGSQSGQPGLAFVQGTVVHQDWIGEMALQYLRTPHFPALEIVRQAVETLLSRVATQQL